MDNTLTLLRSGQKVPAAARSKLLARQRSALAWSRAGTLYIDHGFAILASEARRATVGEDRSAKRAKAAADRALNSGLLRRPVSAEGWYLLAVLRRQSSGNSAGAVSAVRMSVFTGPHVPVLATLRLQLMLRLWLGFSEDEQQMVYSQIRYTWSVAPDDLAKLAANAENDWPFRVALALQPRELQKFEQKLGQIKENARQAR